MLHADRPSGRRFPTTAAIKLGLSIKIHSHYEEGSLSKEGSPHMHLRNQVIQITTCKKKK